MALIKVHNDNRERVLQAAIETLEEGGTVAFPTETFYGIGVRFDSEEAVARLYALKHRPKIKPVPLIIGNRKLLSLLASRVNEGSSSLMDRFWPGPLTLVLPAKNILSELITAGTQKVAVRMPGESFALQLAESANRPFTATSANPSGMPPAQTAEAVLRYFGNKIDLVIDGGPAPGRLPSTLVEVRDNEVHILREGAIRKELLTFSPQLRPE